MNFFQPHSRQPGLAFLTTYNIEWQSTDLYIIKRTHDEKTLVGQPIEFVEKPPYERLGAPTLRCDDHEGPNQLQHLFNSLWDAGYRPSKERSVDIEPVVQAKDENLSDLRKIIDRLMESQS